MPRRLHKSPTSIEKKVETGLQISTSEGVPTTEAGLTCYIHYYPIGQGGSRNRKKHVFWVLIHVFLVYEKVGEKVEKVLQMFFYFRTNFGKNYYKFY